MVQLWFSKCVEKWLCLAGLEEVKCIDCVLCLLLLYDIADQCWMKLTVLWTPSLLKTWTTSLVTYLLSDRHCYFLQHRPSKFRFFLAPSLLPDLQIYIYILRVSDQNGVSLLYIMLEIHHSAEKPLYISCLRYTILLGNPYIYTHTHSLSLSLSLSLPTISWTCFLRTAAAKLTSSKWCKGFNICTGQLIHYRITHGINRARLTLILFFVIQIDPAM